MSFGPLSVMALLLLVLTAVVTTRSFAAMKERLARLESKVGKICEQLNIDLEGPQ